MSRSPPLSPWNSLINCGSFIFRQSRVYFTLQFIGKTHTSFFVDIEGVVDANFFQSLFFVFILGSSGNFSFLTEISQLCHCGHIGTVSW